MDEIGVINRVRYFHSGEQGAGSREQGVEREAWRWGDGEMGRWGDGEMGRWGDGERRIKG
ncbi:hypothetical protein [Moorena sp. SIO4G3]|uniref:hypothetical protein n=1 Tax=Moorena sp. SIO4G3 TaxID=2607821 RepID=UPI0014295359|nr:hypothetical protein [Moorena sp. SIO4G3]NEO75124.1 hypothetical protein [Moorena sp. SIO4G3]